MGWCGKRQIRNKSWHVVDVAVLPFAFDYLQQLLLSPLLKNMRYKTRLAFVEKAAPATYEVRKCLAARAMLAFPQRRLKPALLPAPPSQNFHHLAIPFCIDLNFSFSKFVP